MNFFVLFALFHVNLAVQSNDSQLHEELYKDLFRRQRMEQLEAIKSFRKISNPDKQYSMIHMMAEKVFSSIQENRAEIEASAFIPGVSEFPTDEKVRDALSNILENTALFSEMIIRFPDIAVAVLKTNNNWDVLLQWGIAFSYEMTYLLDGSTVKLLSLVNQELNHVDRDPNYVNPYRKKRQVEESNESFAEKTRKKKKLRRGPRMVFRSEL